MSKYLLSLGFVFFLVGCGSPAEKTTDNTTTTTPTSTNHIPITQDDTITVVENVSTYIYPLQNDSDADEDNLTISKTTGPGYGQIEILGTYIRYIPKLNFTGVDHIRYTVTDGKDDSNESLIKVYVVSKEDIHTPIGVVDYIYVDENQQVTIDVLANDVSNSDNNLSIKNTTKPSNGTIEIVNHQIVYTPNENYRGEDSFTYTPYNDIYEGNITHVNITVQAVNQAPHGLQDLVTMYENNSIEIDVLANDSDVDEDKIFIDRVSQPSNGQTYIDNNKVVYVPKKNFHGEDSFTYTPHDGKASGTNVLVRIEIKDIDYAPIGVSDSYRVVSQRAAYLNVLNNDTNNDEDQLSIKSVSTPAHGTAIISSDGTIKYLSSVGYLGSDSFSYIATDTTGNDTNLTSVAIEVLAMEENVAPVASNDTASIVTNSSNTFIDIFDNDSDQDGDKISIYSLTQPSNGAVIAVDGGVEYTPNKDFVGEDSFSYTPSDGKETGVAATVTLDVTDANIAPIGVDDTAEFIINKADYVDVLANDFDRNGDALSITIVSNPTNGSVELSQGKVIYTPNKNYLGKDSFSYKPNDGSLDGNVTNVDILVVSQDNLAISGEVTYDKVPATRSGLDYNNITQASSRGLVVELYGELNNLLDETTTDKNGKYRFENLEEGQRYKVRVYARLKSTQWDIKVVDNTQNDAQYVMEGSSIKLESNTTIRDFNAISGWDADKRKYEYERVAAPFAILDSIYSALHKVHEANSSVVFSPLTVNWSIDNRAISGDKSIGYIGTSHFDRSDKELWILGAENEDTDEYDVSVVTHEFGHYLKSQVSRQDSIGGNHNSSAKLDPRLAYEEGWCNAFAGIVHDDPIYIDTTGALQAYSSVFDLENIGYNQKGWFNEGSIQRILYDLYDSNDDDNDRVSLGFAPLFHVASAIETRYPAFLTIFTFTYGLKIENPSSANAIDTLLAGEDINSVVDYYGTNQTNDAGDTDSLPVYKSLTVGQTETFCTETKFGTGNRLLNRILIKVDIPSKDDYLVKVTQVQSANGASLEGDPDFDIYFTDPMNKVGYGYTNYNKIEQKEFELNRGVHLIDLYDAKSASRSCFEVHIEESGNFFEDIIDNIFDIFSENTPEVGGVGK
jgi:hypothetical protein